MFAGILLATVFCVRSLLFDPTAEASAHKGLPMRLWVTLLMYVIFGGQQIMISAYLPQ